MHNLKKKYIYIYIKKYKKSSVLPGYFFFGGEDG